MGRYALDTGRHTFVLAIGAHRIGRGPASDIRLDDDSVSRDHATLRVEEDGVTIEERGSRNGVRVNGQLQRGAVTLSPGDRLKIGTVELKLVALVGDSHHVDTTATRPIPKLGRLSDGPPRGVLSPREEQVISHIARGLTQRQIGEQLGVSAKTVETYRARIAEKLGITSRAEFVTYAMRIGALPLRRSAPPIAPLPDQDPES